MRKNPMEPANTVIRHLGGAHAVAAIVKKHPSRVYRWTYPESESEGTGGLIPAKDQRAILEHARKHRLDIEPGDFFTADRLKAKPTQVEAA